MMRAFRTSRTTRISPPTAAGAGWMADSFRAPSTGDFGPMTSGPADGHQVNLALAVQVGGGKVLNSHAAFIHQLPLPLRSLAVGGLVNADAATLAGLFAQVVAHADDQLLVAVAVQISTPDGMT